MVKENTTTTKKKTAGKTRKPAKNATRKVAKGRAAKAKAHKKASRKVAKKRAKRLQRYDSVWETPAMQITLTVMTVVLLFSFFYYFFIRPYSYRWKPCYGAKAYEVCLPLNYEVHGIDISHHQGEINWDLVKATKSERYPITFAFMKATEGGNHKDTRFDENFSEAKRVGLLRGAYHFYNPKREPEAQADFFIANVNLEKGDLPPVLDIERKARDVKGLQHDLLVFLQRLEQHYGVKPIIYTSYKYKKRYLSTPEFDKYTFWIAHYYVDELRDDVKWQFWQHTDYGTVPGIEGNVDLNVFNGSKERLQHLLIR